jgi:hypothetical protein
MKKLLLILLLAVSLATAKAQDKIITTKQDTIECRIISVNAERISYEQKTSENQVVGKSISNSDVLQYFRTQKHAGFHNSIDHEKNQRAQPEHPFLFSLQGGLSHSLTDYTIFKNLIINSGSSASEASDYIGKLQNGYHINVGLHYLLTHFFGFGAEYNLFYAASKGEFLAQGYGNNNLPLYTNLGLNERLFTHFAGASVLFQQSPDKNRRIKISESLSPGVVLFRDENRSNEYQMFSDNNNLNTGGSAQYYDHANTLTQSTAFGAKGGLSVEYAVTPQLTAGLSGNFLWAKLHKISVKSLNYDNKDQKLDKPIDISHIDYGFSVRYNF